MTFSLRSRRIGAALVAVPLLLAAWTLRRAEPIKFARTPHISSQGLIAFAFHDDIWLAKRDGTEPRRLTAHVARDGDPRFSPDGQQVAFTSNRLGNDDVWIVPITGGEPRQLTFHTGNDEVLYWTPDGKGVVIASARGAHPFGSPLYVAPLDGSIPTPLPMDFGRTGMLKQDMTMVAFNRTAPPSGRKGYKGNNNADISVQDLRTREIRTLTDTNVKEFRGHVHDGHPMWGSDGNIYFVSERDGFFNIWRTDAQGRSFTQVTRHRDDGVANPSISPDGKTIIYENDFDLWTVDVPGGQPRRLQITMELDPKDNYVEFLTSTNSADGFHPSPSGDYMAVDFHGEIVIVPTDASMGEKIQVTNSPWRERFQAYSPDGRKIAYISDESGEEEIWIYDVATATRKKLTTHESTKSEILWAPGSTRIALDADNRIFEVDAGTGRMTEIAHNEAGGYTISEWSADGNWLVYSRSDDEQNSEVYLYDTRAKREHNISRSPFRDAGGLLTADGKYVVFQSSRDAGVNHLFVVSLARITEDPADPLVRERARRDSAGGGGAGGGGGGRGGRGGQAGGDASVPSAPLTIRIDTAGLARRAVQLTTGTNGVGNVFLSRDSRTIYFTSSDTAGAGLYSIGVDGRDRRRIVAGNFQGIVPTPDRRTIFFRQGGGGGGRGGGRGGGAGAGGGGAQIFKMALANTQRRDPVTFSFPVRVDKRGEWEQLFEESWRVMKYRFYDAKMHGKDWAAIKAKYKPYLRYVGANEDVYELANEMIGELNASHTGVSGPSSRTMPRGPSTRFLGFEMEPADGRYKVTHIYRDGPADKEWIDLKVGDYVLAVDGQDIKAGDNYWKILSSTLNDYVPVRVSASPRAEEARTIRINAATSLTDIKYEEWVAKNREFVEKESGGQIAYVHIRSMNQPSLERFQREIDQFWQAKGIVVDIRYNGGGNIDQELIDILERRPYQFWNSRTGARTWGRRPRQAIAGPKVMLINHRSGSDSEVTPQGFRDLGIGRIVGTPTSGAVIATGSYSLINGGSIRTPGSLVITWDPTKPNNYGINLENFGVAPDVWAENTPADELRGFDRELKAAIDEALKMLREGKWTFSTEPNGSR
jgi:tricorn protease